MLRLGAAVCFLRNREDIERAATLLGEVPDMKDAFADAVRAALQYHVAVALRRDSAIANLKSQLKSVGDEDLKALVTAIEHKEWGKHGVLRFERCFDLLLSVRLHLWLL